MGSLFGSKPTIQPQQVIQAPRALPPPAPAVPKIEDTQKEGSKTKERDRRRLATQQGRAATLLTGPAGVQGDDSSGLGTKRLLGG